MNAADQRRLGPWLIGLCLLLAVLWVTLLAGVGRGIHWEAASAPQPLPSTKHADGADAAPPLKQYAEVWQRPLFTTDRKPVPVSASSDSEDVSLDNLQLTGVILAPGMRMALLSDPDDGRTIRVAEGAQVASGDWSLQTLEPRSATFAGHGRVIHLQLKVAARDVAENATTGDTGTPGQGRPLPNSSDAPAESPDASAKARAEVLRKRIKQRRRKQATQAGER